MVGTVTCMGEESVSRVGEDTAVCVCGWGRFAWHCCERPRGQGTHRGTRRIARAREAVVAVARVRAADAVQLIRDRPAAHAHAHQHRNPLSQSSERTHPQQRAEMMHAAVICMGAWQWFVWETRRGRLATHINDAWHCAVFASSWAAARLAHAASPTSLSIFSLCPLCMGPLLAVICMGGWQ